VTQTRDGSAESHYRSRFASRDTRERLRALQGLRLRHGGDPEFAPLVAELASDRSAAIRRLVAEVLSKTTGPAAALALATLTSDPDQRVRAEAIMGFGRIRAESACEPADRSSLVAAAERLLADDSLEGRCAGINVLGTLEHTALAARILEILSEATGRVQACAALALGRMKYAPATEAVLEALSTAGDEVFSKEIAEAVARLGDPRAISHLLSLLASWSGSKSHELREIFKLLPVGWRQAPEVRAFADARLAILKAGDQAHCIRAATELGVLGVPESLLYFAERIETSEPPYDEVIKRELEACLRSVFLERQGSLTDDEAVDRQAWAESDVALRRAILSLVRCKLTESRLLPSSYKDLENTQETVCEVEWWRLQGAREAVEAVASAVQSGAIRPSLRFVLALSHFPDDTLARQLIPLLVQTPQRIAYAALIAMRRLETDWKDSAYREASRRQPFPEDLARPSVLERDGRVAVLLAGLAEIWGADLGQFLRERLELGERGTRDVIELLISKLPTDDAVPFLLERLASENAYGKEDVVDALARHRDPRAVGPLVSLLSDESAFKYFGKVEAFEIYFQMRCGLQQKIFAALDKIDATWRDHANVAAITAFHEGRLRDPDGVYRANAVLVLTGVHRTDALQVAQRALRDRSAIVRWAATLALGQIGGPVAVDAIRRQCSDRARVVGDAARRVLAELGEPVEAPDEKGRLDHADELYAAACANDCDAIERLVSAGAEVDGTRRNERNGWTPLHAAVDCESLDAVALLLRCGADGTRRANSRDLPREMQARTPLHLACDVRGSSPESGARLVALLLGPESANAPAGSDIATESLVAIEDSSGKTPLDIAVRAGNAVSVKLLLEAGADPNHRPPKDRLQLFVALESERYDIAILLLEYGADPNRSPRSDQLTEYETPLHVACWHDDLELARVLLRRGANADARGRIGRTPLRIAAAKGNLELCELLLKHGADPNVRDRQGYNVLDVAEYIDRRTVSSLLESVGCARTGLAFEDGKHETRLSKSHKEALKRLSRGAMIVPTFRSYSLGPPWKRFQGGYEFIHQGWVTSTSFGSSPYVISDFGMKVYCTSTRAARSKTPRQPGGGG
jgi:ankyrin repeat protein/HEAT repeat protein